MLAENQSPTGYNTIEDEYQRSHDSISSIKLTWKDVNVFKRVESAVKCCKRGEKSEEIPRLILDDVSGTAKPGDFLAILGASGSGKTTLLNTLAYRLSSGLDMTGQVKVNGRNVAQEDMKRISGYVGQNDAFVGAMTVLEVIIFYANLKLDPGISRPVKRKMADKLLQQVGLSHVRNSLVGDSFVPGISGGEKTRLAVATQLLLGASLLFLDEVTSGLDSFMAESVLAMMKELSGLGYTILCTIHQPGSELYALFDKVCLMTEGSVAFLGNKEDALTFFEESNYPCPSNYCPTDHFIYTLAIKPGNEVKCRDKCLDIVKSYRDSQYFLAVKKDIELDEGVTQHEDHGFGNNVPTRSSFFCQLYENIHRSFKESIRSPRITRTRLATSIFVALAICCFFFRTSNDIETVEANKSGLLFSIVLLPAVRVLNCCALTLPLAFPTTQREYQDGLYSSSAYYISVVICEIPYMVFLSFIQFFIMWLMVGIRMDAVSFLNGASCVIITAWASCGAGWLIGAVAGAEPRVASSLAAVLPLPLYLFAGVIKAETGTPPYLYPFKYLSWFGYGYRMMMVNEFKDLELQCGDEICARNGTDILIKMGIDPDQLWWPNMAAIAIIGLGFMIIAWIVLARNLKLK